MKMNNLKFSFIKRRLIGISSPKLQFQRRWLSSDAVRYDTVIVGGGPVGSCVALHLSWMNPQHRILVIERDSSYKIASASLSAGGIRQQFSLPENVKMCMYGAEFIKKASSMLQVPGEEPPDLNFRENGYLFLANTDSGKAVLDANHLVQSDAGANWMELLGPTELKLKFPWLNTNGLVMGSFGTRNEGFFDNWGFVQSVRQKAQSLGVQYLEGSVIGAKMSEEDSIDYLRVNLRKDGQPVQYISGSTYVNAAGAWAGRFVEMLRSFAPHSKGIALLPVEARKRCIFNIHCPSVQAPPPSTPLVVDPTGVWFRPEGKQGRYIIGVSPTEDSDPDCRSDSDLETVDQKLFDDIIWPSICERVPSFAELKIASAWAGFYDYNTLDQNGVIGFHPEIKNLLLCNGFSGHGLQTAPAAGRAAAELIEYGRFRSIDLSRMSFGRIVRCEPLLETGIV